MINTKIRLIIIFAAKDGEALYSQQKKKKKDKKLSVAHIINSLLQINYRFKLKKYGKPLDIVKIRYDLNEITYNYTLEVTNRFKGFGMIDIMPEELWTEVRDIVQETGVKTILKKKKCKKAKWLSEEGLQIAVKRREVKSKGEKERNSHQNAEFQRIARRD